MESSPRCIWSFSIGHHFYQYRLFRFINLHSLQLTNLSYMLAIFIPSILVTEAPSSQPLTWNIYMTGNQAILPWTDSDIRGGLCILVSCCNKLSQTWKQICDLHLCRLKPNRCLTGLKLRCEEGCILSGDSREESIPLPSPTPRSHPHSWSPGPSSTCKTSSIRLNPHRILLTYSSASLSPLLRTLVIPSGLPYNPEQSPCSSISWWAPLLPLCHIK